MAKLLKFLTILTAFYFPTISTIQSKEYEKCLPGAVDIVFVVEDSDYVGEANFNRILSAIATFSKSLDIGPRVNQSHLGLVTFGLTGNTVFDVNAFLSNTAVQKMLSETKFSGGTESNLAYGIHFAIKEALAKTLSAQSERREIPKIIYIFTTGRDSSDVLSENILAKENNVAIFALGFGNAVNLKHLTEATGDSKRISQIDSIELVDSQLETFCATVESFAPRPIGNSQRYCPCTLENLWLDMVFVIDASNAVGKNDMSTIRQFIHPLLKSITIGQQKGPYSRVAFVTINGETKRLSDLTTYKNSEEALAGLESLSLMGGNEVNINKGLIEAENIISEAEKTSGRTRKTVVIYMGPVGYDEGCKDRDLLSQQEKADISRRPCEVANQIKSSGAVLITVAIRLPGMENYPYMDFGSDCFQLRNDENMMEHFISKLCKANCYCVEPYTQFSEAGSCTEYGECISKMDLPVGYFAARTGCQLGHTSLANVFSEEKERFLYELAAVGKRFPFWLGMKRNSQMSYVWDVNATKEIRGDYSNWKSGRPADSEGDCAVLEKSEDSDTAYWRSEQCAWDEPSYFYFCQKNTCDTDNYCET